MTRALTKAFLAKKAAQDRIREVVEYRVPRGTQKADVNDLIQEANLRAVATSSLAWSVPGMRAWVSRIAQNAVVDHFRGNARHLKWLDRSVDVQGLPPDAALEVDPLEGRPEDPAAAQRPIESIDERSLQQWLETQVKTKADHLTLEMIRQKAAAGIANAALAAEFGITEGADDQRVQRFKAKWVPRWKQFGKRGSGRSWCCWPREAPHCWSRRCGGCSTGRRRPSESARPRYPTCGPCRRYRRLRRSRTTSIRRSQRTGNR